ncbi:MAG: glycosyl transferase family 2, partial [Selenomonadaceae bacterium]|nr:glycosyl transferase family 2 [Selenomonadaceae bacterium]
MSRLDDKKIAFITCVNSDWWYSECRLYLEHLTIPEGMTAEFIDVRDAQSMTAGYNRAMKNAEAKYKIYLPQDTFVVNKNLIAD